MATRPKIIGQLLVESGCVTSAVLDEVLAVPRARGERLGEALVRAGHATGEDVARALSVQLGLPYAAPPLAAERDALELVRPELVRAHGLLPLSVTPKALKAAMADPLDLAAVDDLQFQSGRRVQIAVGHLAIAIRDRNRFAAHGGMPLDQPVNGTHLGREKCNRRASATSS